jgi:hypothetical protein
MQKSNEATFLSRLTAYQKLVILLFLSLLLVISANAGTTGDLGQEIWDKMVLIFKDAYVGYVIAGIGMISAGQIYVQGDKGKAAERGLLAASFGVITDMAEKTAGAMLSSSSSYDIFFNSFQLLAG